VSLIVRRLKVMDIPVLESLERESADRHAGRAGWMESYRKHVERSMAEEPEGFLVAELNDKVVGGAIARQRGRHASTGVKQGQIVVITAAPAYARYQVGQRLLSESFAYLKSRGCKSVMVTVPTDAQGEEIDVYKSSGFNVVSWELERDL
jgi:ribosomal protein S18 acetylase RimI-like enzyme